MREDVRRVVANALDYHRAELDGFHPARHAFFHRGTLRVLPVAEIHNARFRATGK
jgi:hypothetical protein